MFMVIIGGDEILFVDFVAAVARSIVFVVVLQQR